MRKTKHNIQCYMYISNLILHGKCCFLSSLPAACCVILLPPKWYHYALACAYLTNRGGQGWGGGSSKTITCMHIYILHIYIYAYAPLQDITAHFRCFKAYMCGHRAIREMKEGERRRFFAERS